MIRLQGIDWENARVLVKWSLAGGGRKLRLLSWNSVLNLTSFGFASHFADDLVSTDYVGHVYFQCDEIRSSSAQYRQNLSYFPEIKLQIHVMARLALDIVFSQKIHKKCIQQDPFTHLWSVLTPSLVAWLCPLLQCCTEVKQQLHAVTDLPFILLSYGIFVNGLLEPHDSFSSPQIFAIFVI